MAKEAKTKEEAQEAAPPVKEEKKSFFTKKTIIFFVVVFLVQLAAFYFLTAKFLVPPSANGEAEVQEEEKKDEVPVEKQMYLVKDIIINPAGTNGTRFLMTTIGFEVKSPEAKVEIEKKEVEVRDILNTVLTSKGLDDLADVRKRDALRQEITLRVGEVLKDSSLTKVYFSKFIIQ